MARLDLYRPLTASLIVLCLGGGVIAAPGISPARTPSPRNNVVALVDDKKEKEEEPKGDPVDVDKLPKAVVDAVKKAYPGAKITKAIKLEDGNYYLDDVKVGKKLWDLTVTPKGEIVKQVEMKEGT